MKKKNLHIAFAVCTCQVGLMWVNKVISVFHFFFDFSNSQRAEATFLPHQTHYSEDSKDGQVFFVPLVPLASIYMFCGEVVDRLFWGAVRPSAMRTVPPVVNVGWCRFTLERLCHAIKQARKKRKQKATKKKLTPMFESSIFPCLTRYGKPFAPFYPFVCQFKKMFSGEGRDQCSSGEEKEAARRYARLGISPNNNKQQGTTWCKHRSK